VQIAFIGGGQMATSLIGALRARGVAAAAITVADPDAERTEALARDYGVRTTRDNAAAARDADVIVIAVKPEHVRAAAAAIGPVIRGRRPLVLSVAAGVRLADLAAWLGADAALVRAMPNRPALIGRGITALYAPPEVRDEERVRAAEVLAASGETVWIDAEPLLDVVTAVSGSGPAYFFLLMEALEDAGRAQGLPAEVARRLAVVTAQGAGAMAATLDASPKQLRDQVTSRGGTTAAALAVLDAADLRGIFSAAVAAATRRAAELAAQSGDR
jgi:pyrroline-5-carboxylate reductase